MNKTQREKIKKQIKIGHDVYLNTILGTSHFQNFEKRFDCVQSSFRDILRKEHGSKNSLKGISTLAHYLFGLLEDVTRLKLPLLSLDQEIEILNDFVIAILEQRRVTRYESKCASYGETLLNCYLDLFVTLTVIKTPRHFGAKPSFLMNPVTDANLELDIILEDFRLAFEFQGEHHYVKTKVIERDKFKLVECANFQRILVPVNPYQLQSIILQTLILNSIKDQLKIGTLLSGSATFNSSDVSASNKQLLQFSKVAQRMFLSNILFLPALCWVDAHAASYIATISSHSPISTTTNAPRLIEASNEMDVESIYRKVALITKLRKGKFSA